MNDRERRDFEAGLAAEVDAFLRGEPTRRTFITRFGQMVGMLPLSGALLDLGELVGAGAGGGRAGRSEHAARPGPGAGARRPRPRDRRTARPSAPSRPPSSIAGVNLNMTYEAGLQALDPRNFSGPMWEQLTGIKSNVVELSIAGHVLEADRRAHRRLRRLRHPRHLRRQWTPSLADGGVIAPLDDYIAKYMNMADLEDYHPLYKALPTYKGKIWGFFDDGDMFALYYRKDIFEDPKLKEAYQAKFDKKLDVPKTWEDYAQIAQFITDQMAPNVYGAGHFRKAGSPGNQFDFMQQFRSNGGQFFDDEHEGRAGLDGRRQDAREHDRRQQGLDPRQQRTRRRVAVGGVPAPARSR